MQNKLPEGWKEVELGDVLNYEQPTDYIVNSEDYSDEYKTPVLTAGKSFILGYTNEKNGIYSRLPVIIFDDFTVASKYVKFKFKVKSSAMKLLTPKTKEVNLKYIFWLMQTIKVNSVSHKRYYLSKYQHIKVPLPPFSTQQKIVSILEKAEKAKEMRQEADELIKEFLKAVFLEMFGDPVTNNKKFPIVRFKDVALIERNSIAPEKIKIGDKYVGLEHLESESGRIIEIVSVSEGDLKSNKFSFDEDCILYGKLRPYLNKIALPDFNGVCSTDILPIRPIKEKSEKYFISHILKHPYYIRLATDHSVGANLPRLSPRELESFEIIYPPLPLQHKFASIVKEVEQLKEQQTHSKEQIDNLFNILMQKAFKGELIS